MKICFVQKINASLCLFCLSFLRVQISFFWRKKVILTNGPLTIIQMKYSTCSKPSNLKNFPNNFKRMINLEIPIFFKSDKYRQKYNNSLNFEKQRDPISNNGFSSYKNLESDLLQVQFHKIPNAQKFYGKTLIWKRKREPLKGLIITESITRKGDFHTDTVIKIAAINIKLYYSLNLNHMLIAMRGLNILNRCRY